MSNLPTPKQARVMWFALSALSVAVLLALLAMVFWGLSWFAHELAGVLVPLGVALILAYILDPVVDFFVRKKVPRLWSVCLVFALASIAFTAVVFSVLPDLRRESSKLSQELPRYMKTATAKLDHFMETSPVARVLPRDWLPKSALQNNSATNDSPTTTSNTVPAESTSDSPQKDSTPGQNQNATANTPQKPLNPNDVPGLEKVVVAVAKWFTAQLGKVTTWVEFLIGFILVPVYLFYFLLERDSIEQHWPNYLPVKESAIKNEIVFVLRNINECMIVFFRGQVLVALCVGVLITIGYLVLGLNYAVLLGLVAAALGIVPYLGTITSLALALTVAAFQFGDWTHPLIVLGIASVVKILEDFVISPRILGERSGLHPLTVILAVLVGTTLLGGFIGAMLAIPLTAALRTMMFRYVWSPDHPSAKSPTGKHSAHSGAKDSD